MLCMCKCAACEGMKVSVFEKSLEIFLRVLKICKKFKAKIITLNKNWVILPREGKEKSRKRGVANNKFSLLIKLYFLSNNKT